jgi:hypothetical protein
MAGEQVGFDISPAFAELPEVSNARPPQPFCFNLYMPRSRTTRTARTFLNPLPAAPTRLIRVAGGRLQTEFIFTWTLRRLSRPRSCATDTKFEVRRNYEIWRHRQRRQYETMDEGDIWLKISNSCAAIAGRHSRLLPTIRIFFGNMVTPHRSAASHAARPRNKNNPAVAAVDIPAANPREPA